MHTQGIMQLEYTIYNISKIFTIFFSLCFSTKILSKLEYLEIFFIENFKYFFFTSMQITHLHKILKIILAIRMLIFFSKKKIKSSKFVLTSLPLRHFSIFFSFTINIFLKYTEYIILKVLFLKSETLFSKFCSY